MRVHFVKDDSAIMPHTYLAGQVKQGTLFRLEGRAGVFVKPDPDSFFMNSKLIRDIVDRGDCILINLTTYQLTYCSGDSRVSAILDQYAPLSLRSTAKFWNKQEEREAASKSEQKLLNYFVQAENEFLGAAKRAAADKEFIKELAKEIILQQTDISDMAAKAAAYDQIVSKFSLKP